MAASRLHAAIVALAAACAADSTLVGLGTVVSDGLPVNGDRLDNLLVIGGTYPDDGLGVIAEGQQEWRSDGGTSAARDESVDVRCFALVETGDVDVATTRASAFAIVAAVEALLRASYTLGLSSVMSVEVVGLAYQLTQGSDGTRVVVPFTVRIRSVI